MLWLGENYYREQRLAWLAEIFQSIGRRRVGGYLSITKAPWRRQRLSERVIVDQDMIDGVPRQQWLEAYQQWLDRRQALNLRRRFWLDPFGWRARSLKRVYEYDALYHQFYDFKVHAYEQSIKDFDRSYTGFFSQLRVRLGKIVSFLRSWIKPGFLRRSVGRGERVCIIVNCHHH